MSVDSLNNSSVGQYYNQQSAQRIAYSNRSRNNPSFKQAQESDSFERSDRGGGLGRTLMYVGLGGAGGAALGYYFNGNPITEAEGKLNVNEKFYPAYDNAIMESKITKAISDAELNAIKEAGINSKEELEALRKLAAAENIEALSQDVRKALPKNITTPEAASKLVQEAEAEIAKIDKSAIAKGISEKTGSIKALTDKIKNLTSFEEGLKTLPDNPKSEELKKFITDNKELLGIKGDEATVTREIEEYSKLGKNGLLNKIAGMKKNTTSIVENVNGKIIENIDGETKALKKESPEYLKNAFKNFKWSQAKTYGLWGAGLAAATYFISSLFSNGNKK